MTDISKTTHPAAGFTIIEVLVVVAILAILTAIAVPQYAKYVTNARRADGKSALVAAAQAMERYFTNNYSYVGATIGNSSADHIPTTSDGGYYILSFPQDVNATNPSATAFSIQAVADPNGKQANDAFCKTLTINHLGEKGAESTENADTTSQCW